jgi:hypothetical protein
VGSGSLASVSGVSVSVQVEAVKAGNETLDAARDEDGRARVVLVQGDQTAHEALGRAGSQGAAGGGNSLRCRQVLGRVHRIHVLHRLDMVVLGEKNVSWEDVPDITMSSYVTKNLQLSQAKKLL